MANRTNDRKTMWTNPKSEWDFSFLKVDFTEEQTNKLASELREHESKADQERIDAYDSSVQDSSLAKSVG